MKRVQRAVLALAGVALSVAGPLAAPAHAEGPVPQHDLSLTLVPVTGAVGDVVAFTFTFRNEGPDALTVTGTPDRELGNSIYLSMIFPSKIVDVVPDPLDPTCTVFTHSIRLNHYGWCLIGPMTLPAGGTVTRTYTGKIASAFDGWGGMADVNYPDDLKRDPNRANNHVEFDVKVSPGPTPSSPASASASASATAVPSLPVTGDRVGLFAATGAAAVVAGGALWLLARRRRVLLVTPDE